MEIEKINKGRFSPGEDTLFTRPTFYRMGAGLYGRRFRLIDELNFF